MVINFYITSECMGGPFDTVKSQAIKESQLGQGERMHSWLLAPHIPSLPVAKAAFR
jgi:hypothetical protein